MFTGLIEQIGTISKISGKGITIQHSFKDIAVGESIAVNGICLTATSIAPGEFTADISGQTIKKTTLAHAGVGNEVNLERALTLNSRLGGHMVQGHGDGVGEILTITEQEDTVFFEIKIPDDLKVYIVPQGSISLDGISLTVAGMLGERIKIAMIPHTRATTTWRTIKKGTLVNIEVDILSKYMERFVTQRSAHDLYEKRSLNMNDLMEGGFE